MKTRVYLIILLSILVTSCSSIKQSSVNDDLYYSPKDKLLAASDDYENPTFVNKDVSISKEYDDKISEILEDDSKESIDTVIYEDKEYQNPYDRVVVDNYNEAYEKRFEAMESPYYGISNSYVIFSDDYWYAQSFIGDPYYNVVIAGDRIWVEPYWVSSSFFYRPSWYYYGGYYSPYYSYYSPFYYGSYYRSFYSYPYSPYYSSYYWGAYPYHHYYNTDNYYNTDLAHYSQRRRGLASSGSLRQGVADRNRELPESYMGRNIRSSSTVKSGLDRTNRRTGRDIRSDKISSENIARESIRVRGNDSRRGSNTVTRTDNIRRSTANSSSTVTRNTRTTRSTYSTSNRSTRYSRPVSTSGRSNGYSTSRYAGSSTYSPSRSGASRSGSSYSPRSSRTYRGSSTRSSSSRSSGSIRSSGSSGGSVRSSGSSSGSRSSGSSSSSSSGRSSRER